MNTLRNREVKVKIATALGKSFEVLALVVVVSLGLLTVGYIAYLTYFWPTVGLTFLGAIIGLIIGIFLLWKLVEFIETYRNK